MSVGVWLWVVIAGAAGVGIRAGLVGWLEPSSFPWATLLVNVVGGLAMGLIQTYSGMGSDQKMILGVGLLGGLTTFSAFSWESLRILQAGHFMTFAINISANNILSISACAVGYVLAKGLA